MDPFGRRRLVGDRVLPRVEALPQAVAERAVELAVSALDLNALLDRVDLNRICGLGVHLFRLFLGRGRQDCRHGAVRRAGGARR